MESREKNGAIFNVTTFWNNLRSELAVLRDTETLKTIQKAK